jgi:hypothetical protein
VGLRVARNTNAKVVSVLLPATQKSEKQSRA